jgi:hypothetical protein
MRAKEIHPQRTEKDKLCGRSSTWRKQEPIQNVDWEVIWKA